MGLLPLHDGPADPTLGGEQESEATKAVALLRGGKQESRNLGKKSSSSSSKSSKSKSWDSWSSSSSKSSSKSSKSKSWDYYYDYDYYDYYYSGDYYYGWWRGRDRKLKDKHDAGDGNP